jgi:carbon monoxide dehydrogenase subunit G
MRIAGSNTIPFPVQEVWDAILDPQVLVATIPGCERLETTGTHSYGMTVSAGVAAIKGTYAGSCHLSDLAERESLVMRLQGAGAPGTVDATVDVSFEDLGAEGTRISYEADAVVGGMVGGVGQRMLTSVSKRMAKEFFDNVGAAIAAPAAGPAEPDAVAEPGAPDAMPKVYTDAARPGRAPAAQDDFLRGIAVGAGLVLLGVVAGSVLGRRR